MVKPSYRTLRGYGLTRAQARAALGLDEVWKPAEPRERVLVVVDDVGEVPREAWDGLPVMRQYPRRELQQRGGGWVSICDRVPDPLVVHRRGGGVPVR